MNRYAYLLVRSFALLFLPLVLSSAALVSCTSEEKPSVTSPPAAVGAGSPHALKISPKEPTRNATLTLFSAGFDLSEARIVWLIDGEPTGTTEPGRLVAADMFEIRKGVTIQAKAVVEGVEVLSDIVTIANAPPELTGVQLLPEIFRPGDTLHVQATATDSDGDPVTVQNAWTKNREPAGTGKRMKEPLKRDDIISVRITPYDGEDYGRHVDFQREIRNMPPMIAENRKFSFKGDQYTYQTKASDPDGDTLTYSLGSAPQGMTIDSGTGLVQWTVPKEFTGKATAAITVDDGNSGVANYVVNITITSTKVK